MNGMVGWSDGREQCTVCVRPLNMAHDALHPCMGLMRGEVEVSTHVCMHMCPVVIA